ncbi:MAG: hypothetical protein ACKVP0_19830 [Pirellulaceae bacterium]
MKRTIALLAVITVSAIFSAVHADYSVSDRGEWPDTWPKELEPLRKHAQTYEGPRVLYRHYLIPFTKREEFEAAWPHLLKVKTKGAPIILVRGPKTSFFSVKPAGVHIQTPPLDPRQEQAVAEVSSEDAKKAHGEWRTNATYIELVVDGEIVDLNRLPLPADTPIIDERFQDVEKKPVKASK